MKIPEDELQNGDLIVIQTGDLVAADLKLVEAVGLEVDEFELTGKVMPVPKCIKPGVDVLVFRGSKVTRGQGKGIVVAAGDNTEYGKILKQLYPCKEDIKVPLLKKRYFIALFLLVPALLMWLKDYTNYVLLCMVYSVLALLLLLLQNNELFKFILGRRQQKKLLKTNIILRDIKVLDEIRKIDICCFDKTGVLTTRDLNVKEVYIGGEKSAAGSTMNHGTRNLVITGCALCNDLTHYEKMEQANSLDRALINFARENGVKIHEVLWQYERVYDKPFNSEERFMACGLKERESGKLIYFAKGDPEVILKICKSYVTPFGDKKSLDFECLSAVRTKMDDISNNGGIIIALAYGENLSVVNTLSYTFLCLFHLENPLKPETKGILSALTRKGIRNIMLTGDRTETALRIGAEAGIDNAAKFHLTGKNVEMMQFSEVARQCEYVSVFTGLLPSQKGLIVRLLQQNGHKAAMIGDGANDLVALKTAVVGISFVEQSSPWAKRVAKVLINDLTDILHVIEAARSTHWQARFLTVFRMLIILMILLGSYLCAFL